MRSINLKKFKFEFDKFLKLIPEEPQIPNYVTVVISNNILDQLSERWLDETATAVDSLTRPSSRLNCFEPSPSIPSNNNNNSNYNNYNYNDNNNNNFH